MEIVVSKENMHRALQFLQTISDKKNIMPILSNVSLQASPQKLRLCATDLEVSVDYYIDVDSKRTGMTTVSSKKLFEIVKELPSSDFTISCDSANNITVLCRTIVFKLKGLPNDEFPKFPSLDSVGFSEINSKTFGEMIEKTMYAIASDDMQYNLTGINVEMVTSTGMTRFVATDGHRLSMVDRAVEFPLPAEKSIIVPRKGLTEIRKVIHDEQGTIKIAVVDNHLVLQQSCVTLYVRLIDGVFPNYQEVIPKLTTKKMTINRCELLDALRRASIVSQDKFRGVNLEAVRNGLIISSSNPDVGESEEKIDVNYEDEGFRISFNSRYLMDIVASLECEDITMEVKDESSPVVIKDGKDEYFLGVVMPMRL